jgi:hypothetical protein
MSRKICCGQKQIKINDQCPPFFSWKRKKNWRKECLWTSYARNCRIKGNLLEIYSTRMALRPKKGQIYFSETRRGKEREFLGLFFLLSTQIYVSLIECDLPRERQIRTEIEIQIFDKGRTFVITQDKFQFPSGKIVLVQTFQNFKCRKLLNFCRVSNYCRLQKTH